MEKVQKPSNSVSMNLVRIVSVSFLNNPVRPIFEMNKTLIFPGLAIQEGQFRSLPFSRTTRSLFETETVGRTSGHYA
jgi:hypothetical protein